MHSEEALVQCVLSASRAHTDESMGPSEDTKNFISHTMFSGRWRVAEVTKSLHGLVLSDDEHQCSEGKDLLFSLVGSLRSEASDRVTKLGAR